MYLAKTLCTLILILSAAQAYAECPDWDARAAADKAAEKYVSGKIFKRGMVLKKHLPSKRKEVASYIYVKADDLYYTVYALINSKCNAQIIKRTNGKH
ncbi:hypothetical protein [Marinomonas posidonica]|uniref:PepSY domain-containing protein n=1 Tax=Marinomonas posidonica (strain CECT 7376 / NCIMB 14433 / IVIA-Po-181) TaxID=491952 RepID=F6CZZ5_MARPP|nr:hypothetical protein [Marinomonas posidonica]AEF54735.1 hypothetical protein Mar181_1697 [Marinomonas posidonica IVIA-Po-181]